jgi:hypothetical protein
MHRALPALAFALWLGSCVTATGVVQRDDRVGLPLLGGAVAADLVVSSLAASQIQSYSAGASLATGLTLTAVDVAIGCLIGACAALRP